jgi:hypothetical protein
MPAMRRPAAIPGTAIFRRAVFPAEARAAGLIGSLILSTVFQKLLTALLPGAQSRLDRAARPAGRGGCLPDQERAAIPTGLEQLRLATPSAVPPGCGRLECRTGFRRKTLPTRFEPVAPHIDAQTWRPILEDDDPALVDDLVRVTVGAAGLQRWYAEFPGDLTDAARRALRVRSVFTGPADPMVAPWPMAAAERPSGARQ